MYCAYVLSLSFRLPLFSLLFPFQFIFFHKIKRTYVQCYASGEYIFTHDAIPLIFQCVRVVVCACTLCTIYLKSMRWIAFVYWFNQCQKKKKNSSMDICILHAFPPSFSPNIHKSSEQQSNPCDKSGNANDSNKNHRLFFTVKHFWFVGNCHFGSSTTAKCQIIRFPFPLPPPSRAIWKNENFMCANQMSVFERIEEQKKINAQSEWEREREKKYVHNKKTESKHIEFVAFLLCCT